MGEHTVEVSDDTFESLVIKSSHPVLVDFWAEWCAPCRSIAPALDHLAELMKGKMVVAKINIDNNPNTPGRYGVRGIPTLMLFKNGKVEATKIGGMPAAKLTEWVKEHVA